MGLERKRLGDILVSEGVITDEQVKEAISFQSKNGGRLGEVLIQLAYVTEEQIVIALSKQLAVPYVSLASGKLKPAPDQNLEELIPYDFAIRNFILPLSRSLNSLTVVMFDPLDLILLDNIKKLTGCEVNTVVATKSDLLKAVEVFYGKDKLFREAVEAAQEGRGDTVADYVSEETDLSLDHLIAKAEEALERRDHKAAQAHYQAAAAALSEVVAETDASAKAVVSDLRAGVLVGRPPVQLALENPLQRRFFFCNRVAWISLALAVGLCVLIPVLFSLFRRIIEDMPDDARKHAYTGLLLCLVFGLTISSLLLKVTFWVRSPSATWLTASVSRVSELVTRRITTAVIPMATQMMMAAVTDLSLA